MNIKFAAGCFSIIIASICSGAYAASYPIYNCPNTFKSIQVGSDTTTSVQTACGTPTSTSTRQIQISTPVTTTQWIYTLGYITSNNVAVFLPTLTITFANQKVTQIDRSGSPIMAGGYCNLTGVVNIGDNSYKVLATCGQPNFTNTHQESTTTTKSITEWVYNYGPYKPQIILDFDSTGKLTQITTGQLGQ